MVHIREMHEEADGRFFQWIPYTYGTAWDVLGCNFVLRHGTGWRKAIAELRDEFMETSQTTEGPSRAHMVSLHLMSSALYIGVAQAHPGCRCCLVCKAQSSPTSCPVGQKRSC